MKTASYSWVLLLFTWGIWAQEQEIEIRQAGSFQLDEDNFPGANILERMLMTYLLIKGWVGFVNLILRPFEKRQHTKSMVLKIKKVSKQSLEKQTSNSAALRIVSVRKTENQFDLNVLIYNNTAESFQYRLKECYYLTHGGLQIGGDTLRLVVFNSSHDSNRILPGMSVERSIAFYNTFADFSDADRLVCSVAINGQLQLLTADLHGIELVQLVPKSS